MHCCKISPLRGFTLLELLVVLAIAGLLVAIVPPVISAAVPGTELKSAAREMAIALRESRMRAISHGSTVDVVLMHEPARYTIGDEPPQSLPRDSAVAVYELSVTGFRRSAQYARVREEQHRLQFFPDGSSSGALVILSKGERHYSLRVGWLMGKVTVTQETDRAY